MFVMLLIIIYCYIFSYITENIDVSIIDLLGVNLSCFRENVGVLLRILSMFSLEVNQ